MDHDIFWDVVVVGGGAAGMMAAGVAAKAGARVVVIEKNATLGKKLLITGGGRCNVTNAEFDTRKLLLKFKGDGKFLFSAFAQWSVAETLDFFHVRGMDTKIENELRTFPVSNSAQSVWDVLVRAMKQYNVTVLSHVPVVAIMKEGKSIIGVKLGNKKVIRGKSFIIATGGTSRPETGSTGDAYRWLTELGHTVITPTPSLVPLAIKDAWIKNLAGLTLQAVKITIFQNGIKQGIAKGKILFTHVGVSGPTILTMSRDIGELLKYGDVMLSLDLFPATDHGALDARLQELFKKHDKKKIGNALPEIIEKRLSYLILKLSGVNPEIPCNSITRVDRKKISHVLKAIPMQVYKLLGIEKAIITSGGVNLQEVDFKTMRSRLFPNLYLIGDILNIDRPSGGYSLQLCWTTGFVAGIAVAGAIVI